jgi:hypothetical protein
VADQVDEDQMFMAIFFSTRDSSNHWLIDNYYTNHMTFNKSLFRTLQPIRITKVRIGNDDYIATNGKGTIAISINSGTKTISDFSMYLI